MSTIHWRDEYNLGIEEIDFEHKIFVKIIQKIERAIIEKKDESYINRLVQELKKYASFHFQSEENMMVEIKYPHLISHKLQHEHLLSQLQLVIVKVEIGEQDIRELPEFLLNWFKKHTLEEDKKLSKYL